MFWKWKYCQKKDILQKSCTLEKLGKIRILKDVLSNKSCPKIEIYSNIEILAKKVIFFLQNIDLYLAKNHVFSQNLSNAFWRKNCLNFAGMSEKYFKLCLDGASERIYCGRRRKWIRTKCRCLIGRSKCWAKCSRRRFFKWAYFLYRIAARG